MYYLLVSSFTQNKAIDPITSLIISLEKTKDRRQTEEDSSLVSSISRMSIII